MEDKELFYKDHDLNGQSQCYGCKQRDKWNVGWASMMWINKENEHFYCDECKEEYIRKEMNKND